jgi:hypothetical protein
MAAAMSLWSSVMLGLFVAREVLGIAIPAEASHWSEDHAELESLASSVRRQLSGPDNAAHGNIFSARFDDARYWFALLELPKDRLRYLINFLVSFVPSFRVNEKDRQFVRLAPRYRFLYYALRPVRLARDYAGPIFRSRSRP